MAEWAEPCEWCARSNRVLRENLIAKTARKASHADSQKVCRVTRLRVLCVCEKQTRARRVEQTGKEHTHWRAAQPAMCVETVRCAAGVQSGSCRGCGCIQWRKAVRGKIVGGKGCSGVAVWAAYAAILGVHASLFLLYGALGAQDVRQGDLGCKLIC